jgi:hypothetical protein
MTEFKKYGLIIASFYEFESNWTGSIQPGARCNMTILQIVIEN